MAFARAKVAVCMPVDATTIGALDDEQIAALDQYIYRFNKWQDTMAARAFDQALRLLAEDVAEMAFIDKLNRLEKLDALPSATRWLDLRALRNTLAHEYADNVDELAHALNTLFDAYNEIQHIAATFDDRITAYLDDT